MASPPSMDALILAGGLGTRLRPVLKDFPKSMARIAGRPFLEYLLLQVQKQGLSSVVLCVGYRNDVIQSYFRDGSRFGLCLRYSIEEQPLGTGGALKHAEGLIETPDFFVLNGDSFFDVDFGDLAELYRSRKARGAVALAKVDDSKRFGLVEVNCRGEILRFKEKANAGPGLINGGIYALHRSVLELIPDRTEISLEQQIFPRLLGDGFYGCCFEGYFVDFGVPEEYQKLQSNPSGLLAATHRGGLR